MNVDGVLYQIVLINGNWVKQVMLPENLKSQVFDAVHDQMGHKAVEKTLTLVRVRYVFLVFYGCIMLNHIANHARDVCCQRWEGR